ncbi:flavodoxin domain-containing protein [Streptomyces sp. NBC_01619]|uniref:Flavodoxin domain-containing protein n=1 Tax=Streptomyces pratisoli TaxID=3139917 RepID=A0ACC6QA76_9ACTN|nr:MULTISPECIES: flavodoxin domain-containing protein [unclassified Streptomyces]MCX4511025.1 flavodoxin domain-containing protein [Streptomyces sp. NBC_01619]
MTRTALVAYGTTNGSTAEIARYIGSVLQDRGIRTEVRPAAEVHDVGPYDVVVLGGALYSGRWHRDARRFSRRHRRALAERPVWLFSSGPLDHSASRGDIAPVPGARRAARRLGAEEHVTFGGRLSPQARGRVARMMLEDGRGGDFRDFSCIAAWAERIAADLVALEPERR